MVDAFGQLSRTEEHTHAILAAAASFRYPARREPVATLRSILSHDYLAIPLHLFDIHWALALVANPTNLLPENRHNATSPTYIYTLDSLEGDERVLANARASIRSWLMFCANQMLGSDVHGTDIIDIEVVQVCSASLPPVS